MTLNEKVAYLKGLIEGLKLDETKPENKVIKAMADLLDDIALTVTDLEDTVDTLDEYVEELDDDLAQVEDIVYDGSEEYEDDEDDEDDEDEEGDADEDEIGFYGDEDDDSEFYEVMCPKCKEIIYLDDTIDPTKVTCPNCLEEFDVSGDCTGDCTGCTDCGSQD